MEPAAFLFSASSEGFESKSSSAVNHTGTKPRFPRAPAWSCESPERHPCISGISNQPKDKEEAEWSRWKDFYSRKTQEILDAVGIHLDLNDSAVLFVIFDEKRVLREHLFIKNFLLIDIERTQELYRIQRPLSRAGRWYHRFPTGLPMAWLRVRLKETQTGHSG